MDKLAIQMKCAAFASGKIEMPNPTELVVAYITQRFGNRAENQRVGLGVAYEALAKAVVSDGKAGMGAMMHGLYLDENNDIKIGDYKMQNGDTIVLTVKTICEELVDKYLHVDDISRLCIEAAGEYLDYNKPPDFK